MALREGQWHAGLMATPSPRSSSEAVDPLLLTALAPVLRDSSSVGVAVRVSAESWQLDEETYPSAMLWTADGAGVGVYVARAASEEERVAVIADQVQELAVKELAASGASNWPPCAEHPGRHPLTAAVAFSGAVWRCDYGGSTSIRIGAL